MSQSWEARMAERARARREIEIRRLVVEQISGRTDKANWPVPDDLKGYSGRDCFLWYIADGYRRIFGGSLKVVFDHDFGYHVLTDGEWQVEVANLSQFPDRRFPEPEDDETIIRGES